MFHATGDQDPPSPMSLARHTSPHIGLPGGTQSLEGSCEVRCQSTPPPSRTAPLKRRSLFIFLYLFAALGGGLLAYGVKAGAAQVSGPNLTVRSDILWRC